MAKKSLGIGALSEALDEKNEPAVATTRPTPTKAVSSPINAPAMSGVTQRIQRLYLDLPVTKVKAECELKELDPSVCVASRFNKRVQSLLSPTDPAVMQLKRSMAEEGQRDPVLVRPLQTPEGKVQYEVIYGTRRRFVAELLSDEASNDGFTLKAWVSNKISDADAKRLADSENQDRQEISAWEMAQYYQEIKSARPELSLEAIAGIEGVDASSVSRYIQLASLPEDIVKLVSSPSEITLRSGLDILKATKRKAPAARQKLYASLRLLAPFNKTAELLKAIKADDVDKLTTPTKAKKIEVVDREGRKRAIIGAHRTQQGQYKVDLFDLSDDELSAVHQSLAKVLGG